MPSSQTDVHARQYLHYLHLLGQAQTREPALDLLDERLLDFLARDGHGREAAHRLPITVLEAMRLAPMSNTTVHRRLQALRRLGFIALQTDEDDQRIKRVVLTAQAQRHFALKGRCMAQAKGQGSA